MSSPLGNKQNITVFVLYLMQNVGYPMDFVTVNDIIMQTDYVAYLDFAESFSRMKDGGLIEQAGATMGCTLPSPFMTMGVMSLACVPFLRLTNRGYVNCVTFQMEPLLAE